MYLICSVKEKSNRSRMVTAILKGAKVRRAVRSKRLKTELPVSTKFVAH